MRLLALLFAVVLSLCGGVARADEGPPEEEPAHQLAAAASALREGRAGDAITRLEALGDRGVVDPVARSPAHGRRHGCLDGGARRDRAATDARRSTR